MERGCIETHGIKRSRRPEIGIFCAGLGSRRKLGAGDEGAEAAKVMRAGMDFGIRNGAITRRSTDGGAQITMYANQPRLQSRRVVMLNADGVWHQFGKSLIRLED